MFIAENELDELLIAPLLTALHTNTSLKVLQLTGLLQDGLRLLSTGSAGNADNEFTDAGAKVLANMLERNTTLRVLLLHGK